MNRLRVTIRGAVQGVGFRPFVHRLATELSLTGWVGNAPAGVITEVEGGETSLREFLLRLQREAPVHSIIQGLEPSWLPPLGFTDFTIRPSEPTGERTALVLPDIATCEECRREIFDKRNRRHRYPFTNCTHCGPRYSIVESLPYDRARTSMKAFAMCPDCQAEYDHPANRRFHAQPNACPVCGPQWTWRDGVGRALSGGESVLPSAIAALREGEIVAVKGLGGYHLMVRAGDEDAVRRLRARKHRDEKPFALMIPSLDFARPCCEVPALEQRLLESPEAPIVLLQRHAAKDGLIAASVAPGCARLGLMLPATPLHHLLLADLGEAVVATSGNRGDEPICFEEVEAFEKLAGIADYFLTHDRPIVRPVDDSIVSVVCGREMVLRRARGYAPLPWRIESKQPGGNPPSVLAMGAHLKSVVALSRGSQVFLSQHLGDLDNAPGLARYEHAVEDLERLLGIEPQRIAVDAHPDYASTRAGHSRGARGSAVSVVRVQHHYAHALACLAENELRPPALAVVWDGTGYGLDGTIWGGEFLRLECGGFTRACHWRTFRLPGGEAAAREPRRAALGLLWEMMGADALARSDLASVRAFQPSELKVWRTALERGFQAPLTSSVGRLFDAVASLMDVRQVNRFEGQAAMAIEYLAGQVPDHKEAYDFGMDGDVVDWERLIRGLLEDLRRGESQPVMAARFHWTLAEVIIAVARRTSLENVLLTGGCFQNRVLLERAVERLREEGFRPSWPQRVPPNDGGIALGQIVAAS